MQSESTEETVHKGRYQERGHSLLDEKSTETTYPGTDIGQAVQTRGQKLQEGKKFSTLKVLDSLKVNKDEFRSEQINCDTLKWVREKAKSSEKRKSHGTVSWFKDHNGLIYRYFEDRFDKAGTPKRQLVVPKCFRENLLYQSVLEE